MAIIDAGCAHRPHEHCGRVWVAALVAGWLLTGCGARVPPTFDPQPPRLTPGDLQFDDHSKKDEIVILVFGDSGSGSNDQRAVGLRMAEVCETAQCDLALMLGDNFYNRGVRRPENGVWDETFERKFEEPYRDVGQVQFWAVAGNHDWYRGRESVDTEQPAFRTLAHAGLRLRDTRSSGVAADLRDRHDGAGQGSADRATRARGSAALQSTRLADPDGSPRRILQRPAWRSGRCDVVHGGRPPSSHSGLWRPGLPIGSRPSSRTPHRTAFRTDHPGSRR